MTWAQRLKRVFHINIESCSYHPVAAMPGPAGNGLAYLNEWTRHVPSIGCSRTGSGAVSFTPAAGIER